jgi:type II secretory pathway pseudopilin PulG
VKSNNRRLEGFTLLELLVALSIMVGAMAVIILTFAVTLRGWRRGAELLEGLHHGDFVMEQLVSAMRSTAFFGSDPTRYGFWLEDLEGTEYPADRISFVTAGTAFMPPESPLANGLHRIEITVQENEDGEPGVAVRAFAHLTDEEDWEVEPWYVSTVVKGLNVRTYNEREEAWEEAWENTNAVPSLVEVTLYMDPLDEEAREPVLLSRLVEIPIAPAVVNAVAFRDADEAAAEEAAEQAAREAAGSGTDSAEPGRGSGDMPPGGVQGRPSGGGGRAVPGFTGGAAPRGRGGPG